MTDIRETIARAYAKATKCGAPPCCQTCSCVRESAAILTALHDAGLAIVPVEPTREMIEAGNDVSSEAGAIWMPSDGIDFDGPYCGLDVYRAMLSAAPETIPTPGTEGDGCD